MSSLDERNGHPMFEQLKEALCEYIDGFYVTRSIQSDLLEAKESLMTTKEHYFQMLWLYTEIKEILVEHNYGLHDEKYGLGDVTYNINEGNDQKLDHNTIRLLSDMLCTSEAKQCINITLDSIVESDRNLFGLSSEDMDLDIRKKKMIHQNLQQACIPLIEKRLKRKLINLFKFWNPSNQDSEGLCLAKANQLAGSIAKEKTRLAEAKRCLSEETKKCNTVFEENYLNIQSSLEELQSKISMLQSKPEGHSTKVTIDWISAKCDYILSKIKVMKNHLLVETYTTDTVEALSKVRRYLTDEITRTRKELSKTKQSLQFYESIGDYFTDLLEQYTQLTMQIDNKKWALSELQRSKPS